MSTPAHVAINALAPNLILAIGRNVLISSKGADILAKCEALPEADRVAKIGEALGTVLDETARNYEYDTRAVRRGYGMPSEQRKSPWYLDCVRDTVNAWTETARADDGPKLRLAEDKAAARRWLKANRA